MNTSTNQDLLATLLVKQPLSRYYHLSDKDDLTCLLPYISGGWGSLNENLTIPRISIGPSIEDCLIGLGIGMFNVTQYKRSYNIEYNTDPNPNTPVMINYGQDAYKVFMVYEVTPTQPIYKPTYHEIMDAHITNEHWLLHKEKNIKPLGYVKAIGTLPSPLDPSRQFVVKDEDPANTKIFQHLHIKYKWLIRQT